MYNHIDKETYVVLIDIDCLKCCRHGAIFYFFQIPILTYNFSGHKKETMRCVFLQWSFYCVVLFEKPDPSEHFSSFYLLV